MRNPKKIANLSAGDQNGDAVREPDDDGPGKIFDGRAHAGDPEQDKENASHHGALEKAADTILGDDSSNDDDDHECAGGTADLRFGTAQRGDQEASDDCALDSGLRGNPRGDGKRHRERQRDKAYGDTRKQIREEFMPIVTA